MELLSEVLFLLRVIFIGDYEKCPDIPQENKKFVFFSGWASKSRA